MNLWEILSTLLDWLCHWRFNLCFWGGIVLAVLIEIGFHVTIPGHVLAGIAFLGGIVVGIRWDWSH